MCISPVFVRMTSDAYEAASRSTENIFLKLGREENGTFWKYDGNRLPW